MTPKNKTKATRSKALISTSPHLAFDSATDSSIRALEDRIGQLEKILNEVDVYVYTKDRQGRYTYANQKVLDLFAVSINEIIGHDDKNFFDLKSSEDVIFDDSRVMELGQTINREESMVVKASGQTRSFWTVKSPMFNDQGQITGELGISTDITARKMAENMLQIESSVLQDLPVGVCLIGVRDQRIFYANLQFGIQFGYGANELQGCLIDSLNITTSAGPLVVTESIAAEIDRAGRWMGGICTLKKDKTNFSCYATISAIDHPVEGKTWVLALLNVTERQLVEDALYFVSSRQPLTAFASNPDDRGQEVVKLEQAFDSMLLVEAIYQNSSEAILITDENNSIKQINPAFTRLIGYELHEVIGKNPRIFISSCHDKAFYQSMSRELQNNNHWQGEIWAQHKNGSIRVGWLTIHAMLRSHGGIRGYVSQFIDITERKQKEDLILFQSNFDQLTMLPNRILFRDRLDQETKKSHRNGQLLGVIFLDLDHFKDINDTLGHTAGDQLLQEVGQRIKSCVRDTDTVARLGGDEFAIIIPNIEIREHIEKIVRHIIHELDAPYNLLDDQVDYHISTSIGIAFYPEDGMDIGSLMKYADQAMYAAKHAGRDRYCFFTPALQHKASEKMILTNDLRKALARNELHVYYQPILDLSRRSIIKAEALLRWKHPYRGMIGPHTFIPLAEESGLIVKIGEWVFNQSIAHIQQWRDRLGTLIQVSINKSPVQFQVSDESGWCEKLTHVGLPGDCINVEITEGLLLKSSLAVQNFLLQFRNKGIQVSIDDFGTGFASLSYLKEFDIDYIKIDRSFISNLSENPIDRALVEAIIMMAHKLDIKTIAEGVETEEQQNLLIGFGCDYVQGFLYSPPVPIEEFEKLIMS
ncbi:MAG: EAL domain-containing protein [Nitrosomonas sp. PRO4]|nr:EAL domain-containing protein [Nitrosomonas sp. PRO4]